MASEKIAEYRQMAEDCRRGAEAASAKEDKERLFDLAKHWESMAERLEKIEAQQKLGG